MVKKHWPIFIILLFAAIVKIIYIFSIRDNPLPYLALTHNTFDQFRFMQLAQKFVEFGWMNTKITWFSPTYSSFIAVIILIFGKNLTAIFLIQALIGVVGVYVFYKTALLLFEHRMVGYICAAMAATYGVFTFFEATLLRASLITNFNLFAFYFLLSGIKNHKKSHFALSGLCLAISHLLRPNILLPFIVLYCLLTGKNKKNLCIFVSVFLLILAPFTIRNYMLSKNVNISSQGASTFWIGNTHDSSGIGLWRSPLRHQFAKEAGGSLPKTLNILKREIQEHPKDYAHLYWRKIKMYFNGYEIPANLSFDHFREEHPILEIPFLRFSLICPLALIGLIVSFRRYSYMGLPYLFFTVLSLSVLIFHIQSRYRLAAMPFFILFAAYGVYYLCCSLKERRYKSVAFFSVLFVLFTIFTVPDQKIIRKYFGSTVRSIDYSNMASAYQTRYKYKNNLSPIEKEQTLRKALKNFEKARSVNFERNKNFVANCFINEAVFLMVLGDSDEAFLRLEKAQALGYPKEIIQSHVNQRFEAMNDLNKPYEFLPQLLE